MARLARIVFVSALTACSTSTGTGGDGEACTGDGTCEGDLWCLSGSCTSAAEPECESFPCQTTVADIASDVINALDVLVVIMNSG